jgi:hypothetical protein
MTKITPGVTFANNPGWQPTLHDECRLNIRFGSKADMAAHSSDVRFTPQ